MAILGFTLTSSYDYLVFKERLKKALRELFRIKPNGLILTEKDCSLKTKQTSNASTVYQSTRTALSLERR